MNSQAGRGTYEEVQSLIESVDSEGGRMRWRSGGRGGGGVWVLELKGRTTEVPIHSRKKNALDNLYVPKVDEPRTWDDYDHPGTLKNDAFWGLVALFRPQSVTSTKLN